MDCSKDLTVSYSPSYWSNRCGPDEVIERHIQFIEKESKLAQKSIPCELSISYGTAIREKMDIFGTHLHNDAAIFIFIHGGYWTNLSREQSSYFVKPLVKHGFKVIIPGYTLCPEITITDIIAQVQKMFSKCLEYAKVNSSRAIYVCGHSAGAHLACNLATSFLTKLSQDDRNLIKSFFLISGIYDLTPLIKTSYNDALRLNYETALQISPQHQNFYVDSNIKFFVIVGQYDCSPFIEQSEAFHKKLQEFNANSEFIFVPNVDHFLIVEKLNDENYELSKLIYDRAQ